MSRCSPNVSEDEKHVLIHGQENTQKCMPIPLGIHVFHLPSCFGELLDVFDHPSFIHVELVFILHVFSCFLNCACPGNPFWCYGVNGQQRITILGFVAVDLAHAMPKIDAEFEMLILGCFSQFYQSVLGCKTFFLNPKFCILLCVHLFPWSELVWRGIGSELS